MLHDKHTTGPSLGSRREGDEGPNFILEIQNPYMQLGSENTTILNLPIDGSYERARLDRVRADREQMELDIARHNLVIRSDVHNAAFESGRKLRDNLHSLCKQSAPNLVNIDDPSKIEMYLKDEIDAALKEFIDSCAL